MTLGASGIIDASAGSLKLPTSATMLTQSSGLIGIDTTSGQLRYNDGTATRTISSFLNPTFTVSTTTAWSGTTTKALGTAFVAETWTGVQCFTDAGTLDVFFSDGTNLMNKLNASTTVNTVTLSTNNTFTAGEKRYVVIGNPASSPTYISCTLKKSFDSD